MASDERGGKAAVHVFGLHACFYDTMGGESDSGRIYMGRGCHLCEMVTRQPLPLTKWRTILLAEVVGWNETILYPGRQQNGV